MSTLEINTGLTKPIENLRDLTYVSGNAYDDLVYSFKECIKEIYNHPNLITGDVMEQLPLALRVKEFDRFKGEFEQEVVMERSVVAFSEMFWDYLCKCAAIGAQPQTIVIPEMVSFKMTQQTLQEFVDEVGDYMATTYDYQIKDFKFSQDGCLFSFGLA